MPEPHERARDEVVGDSHPDARVMRELQGIRQSVARWKMIAFVAVAMLAGFLSGPLLRRLSALAAPKDAVPAAASVSAALRKASTIDVGAPAAIELFQFTDMQCPYCAAAERGLVEAVKAEFVRAGTVQLRIIQLPLEQIHPNARMAARLMLCVNRVQPTLVESVMARVYDSQSRWGMQPDSVARRLIVAQIAESGIDEAAIRSCEASGETDAQVASNQGIAREVQVPGTPVFYLDGRRLPPDSGAIMNAIRHVTPRSERR